MTPKLCSMVILLTALFTVGCRNSVNPRVATHPNTDARLTGALPSQPLQDRILTSWIDHAHGTMSTLFGNDVAVNYARNHADSHYPATARLSLITWKQQEDARWFGGKIPSTPQAVEYVTVGNSASARVSYERYEGSPLKLVERQENAPPAGRAEYLLSQRAAVMP